LDKPIEADKRTELVACVEKANTDGGLHMQLIFEEPETFTSGMSHYGSFKGVRNYLALVGPKAKDLDERCGYFGQRVVLRAQELGLNTCWVALTYGKRRCEAKVDAGEKLVCVVALGYGQTQGVAHKSKQRSGVCDVAAGGPDWFERGLEAALLAPTAMNQQKFRISLQDGEPVFTCGMGTYTHLDLGIVRHDFESGSKERNI